MFSSSCWSGDTGPRSSEESGGARAFVGADVQKGDFPVPSRCVGQVCRVQVTTSWEEGGGGAGSGGRVGGSVSEAAIQS